MPGLAVMQHHPPQAAAGQSQPLTRGLISAYHAELSCQRWRSQEDRGNFHCARRVLRHACVHVCFALCWRPIIVPKQEAAYREACICAAHSVMWGREHLVIGSDLWLASWPVWILTQEHNSRTHAGGACSLLLMCGPLCVGPYRICLRRLCQQIYLCQSSQEPSLSYARQLLMQCNIAQWHHVGSGQGFS